jgi:hypothetical protein
LISAAIGVVTMEFFPGAYKKATAALDEAARARLRGPFISDTVAPSPAPSGGAADADDDLMDSVDEFYNGYGEHGTDGGAVAKDAVASRATEWKEALRLTLADAAADAAAVRIRAEAERIVRDAGPAAVGGGGGIRKHLVERLRARGYDARNNALLLCSSHFSISYIQHGTLTFLFVLGSGIHSSRSLQIVVGKNQQHRRAGHVRVRGRDSGLAAAAAVSSLHRGGKRGSRIRGREAERRVPGPPLLPAASARVESTSSEGTRRGNVRRSGGVHPRRGHARAAVEARVVRAGQMVRAVRENGSRGTGGGGDGATR